MRCFKHLVQNCIAVGELPTESPYGILSVTQDGGGQLNTGFIVDFSGSFDNGYQVDKSWHICDGTSGTPDLRGRFILGASDTYKVESTGGEASVPLNSNNIPAHSHTFSATTSWKVLQGSITATDAGSTGLLTTPNYTFSGLVSGSDFRGSSHTGDSSNNIPKTIAWNFSHNHVVSGTTSNTGGGQAHNNMPPYYSLSYIMKIG